MTPRQKNPASETFFLKRLMINSRIATLGKIIEIPNELIDSLKDFVERNPSPGTNQCCPKCFKAYALKKLGEMKLNSRTRRFVESLYECDVGHDGYYLDEDKLVKV